MNRVPEGYARVRIRLEWPGASPAAMPWPVYRAFMDALVQAVGALKDGPQPSEVIPGKVLAGSAMPEIGVVESALGAFRRLAKGPKADWSAAERQGVQGLYDVATDMQIELFQIQPGKGRFITMKLPIERLQGRDAAPTTYRQHEVIVGTVLEVGGAQGGALVETTRGRIHCAADFAMTCVLGRSLYAKVQLAGTATRRVADHRLQSFEAAKILQVVLEPKRPGTKGPTQVETLAEIRALLADQWDGRLVSEILGEEG